MRLHPKVTKDEALTVLTNQAIALWGAEAARAMETQLRSLAEAMAAVSAAEVPEDVEPLYFPHSAASFGMTS